MVELQEKMNTKIIRAFKLSILISLLLPIVNCQVNTKKETDKYFSFNEPVLSQAFDIIIQMVNSDTVYMNTVVKENFEFFQSQIISKTKYIKNECKTLLTSKDEISRSDLSNYDFTGIGPDNIVLVSQGGLSISEITYFSCGNEDRAQFFIYWKNASENWVGISYYYTKNGQASFYQLESFEKVSLKR